MAILDRPLKHGVCLSFYCLERLHFPAPQLLYTAAFKSNGFGLLHEVLWELSIGLFFFFFLSSFYNYRHATLDVIFWTRREAAGE